MPLSGVRSDSLDLDIICPLPKIQSEVSPLNARSGATLCTATPTKQYSDNLVTTPSLSLVVSMSLPL